MKHTLTFNIPEEKNELDLAMKGGDYYCQLWDIQEKCRSLLKYGQDEDMTKKKLIEFIEEIRRMAWVE